MYLIVLNELEEYHIDFLKIWNKHVSQNSNIFSEAKSNCEKKKEYENARYFGNIIKEINTLQRVIITIIKDYDNASSNRALTFKKEQEQYVYHIDGILDGLGINKGSIGDLKPLWYDTIEEKI